MAPLQQLNLKLPEEVAAHWRAQAAAQGLSVRDWLVSITAPTTAGDGLADRVAQLEAAAAELREAMAQLQQARPPVAPVPIPADLPADGIETAALAQLLGVKRGTFNARVRRLGGAAPGLLIDGWRCIGTQTPERGGPPRAVWVPAGTPEVEGLAPDGSDDRVPPEGA